MSGEISAPSVNGGLTKLDRANKLVGVTNQTATIIEYECPVVRDGEQCWTFAFPTEAALAEHVESGKHSFPSDMGHDYAVAFESARSFVTDGSTNGVREPRPAYVASEREVEAVAFAKAYTGTFEFMLSMKAKAAKATFRPSPNMVDAILRCKAADAARPTAGDPTAAPSNRFGGDCTRCHNYVEANGGERHNVNGRWTVTHRQDECPEAAAPAVETDVTPGTYILGGTYVKVQKSRQSGKLYGKVHDGHGWNYAPGILRRAGEFRPLTAAEAAAFGHEFHACIFCSRSLSDDGPKRSVQVGYGPVCAEKNDLPWG